MRRSRTAHDRRVRAQGLRPRAELLEGRQLLATFVVTNTDDSGDGSLRDVMARANAAPGADTIAFNIPGDGVHTIKPASALPAVTDPVTIDGYTQPGSRP